MFSINSSVHSDMYIKILVFAFYLLAHVADIYSAFKI